MHMLEIFSGGREPEVGDSSRVVVAVRNRAVILTVVYYIVHIIPGYDMLRPMIHFLTAMYTVIIAVVQLRSIVEPGGQALGG